VLDDASQYAQAHPAPVPPARGAEWAPRTPGLWTALRPIGAALAAGLAPVELSTPAYVSEGRWVVMCPDCGGARFAARDDWRFMCVECANFTVEGLWRPVLWPEDVGEIETELERRPMRRTQNWLPGETVDDLAEQLEAASRPEAPVYGPVIADDTPLDEEG
jgi:hypothetical protein